MNLADLASIDNQFKTYIKDNEGYDENVYLDTKEIPTTGYGFNIKEPHIAQYIPQDVLQGKRALTQPEAESIFSKVYTTAVSDAEQFVGSDVFNKLSPDRKQALIDMSYNLGLTRLNKFQKMRQAIIDNDFNRAGEELLDSKYATEDVPNRAKKNYNLMRGEQPNTGKMETLSKFGKAFKEARQKGLKEFIYDGQKIKVEIK